MVREDAENPMVSKTHSLKHGEYTDVLIIGAGPAGALAAALLCRKGYSAKVFERANFPRFSIGESLLPQSMEFLEEAGALPAVEKAKFQSKKGAAFCCGDRHSVINFSNKFTPGHSETFEVKRAEFDTILADHARDSGAEIYFEHSILAYDEDENGVSLTVQDNKGESSQVRGRFVLDASGFGRVLPRLLDLEKESNFPVRKAIFTHIKDNISHPQFDRNKILITIHNSNPNIWYWLIPFSDGTASIGVVGTPEELDAFGSSDEDRLSALIKCDKYYNTIMPSFEYTRDINSMIGYSCGVSTLYGDKFALLGNAGEFLDPVFSSGVTIAFKSASLAANLLDRQFKGEAVNWEKDFSAPLMVGVNAFREFVESWYQGDLQTVIMNQPKEDSEIKRMITSLLAGYAWDENNALVTKGKRLLSTVSQIL